mmetsp:Transcript_24536/g.69977  ORF Transcript_24536/g.69977 Transcript_24536/m.69977 type:complete len:153 (-) Transcript_24536:100-558(-)
MLSLWAIYGRKRQRSRAKQAKSILLDVEDRDCETCLCPLCPASKGRRRCSTPAPLTPPARIPKPCLRRRPPADSNDDEVPALAAPARRVHFGGTDVIELKPVALGAMAKLAGMVPFNPLRATPPKVLRWLRRTRPDASEAMTARLLAGFVRR